MMPLTCENACFSSIYTIFKGTSEIQRLIIARAVSGVQIR
jgi:acyl-CoA dehydrogenase